MSKNDISYTSSKEKLNFPQQIQNKLPESLVLKSGIILLSIPLVIIGLSIGVMIALAILALVIAVLTIIAAAALIAVPFLWIKNGFSLKNINLPCFPSLQTENNEHPPLLDTSLSTSHQITSTFCNFFKKFYASEASISDKPNPHHKFD